MSIKLMQTKSNEKWKKQSIVQRFLDKRSKITNFAALDLHFGIYYQCHIQSPNNVQYEEGEFQ